MPRDLKAELKYLSENPSITKLMELAEDATDRAIAANIQNTESYDLLYNAFDKVKEEAEQLKQGKTALTEENAHLTAQVAGLREALKKLGAQGQFASDSWLNELKARMDYANSFLSYFDPGAKYRAAIDAAKEFMEFCFPDNEGLVVCDGFPFGCERCEAYKLKQALSNLEGGPPCPK